MQNGVTIRLANTHANKQTKEKSVMVGVEKTTVGRAGTEITHRILFGPSSLKINLIHNMA